MKPILVLYATREGQARRIADQLGRVGHDHLQSAISGMCFALESIIIEVRRLPASAGDQKPV